MVKIKINFQYFKETDDLDFNCDAGSMSIPFKVISNAYNHALKVKGIDPIDTINTLDFVTHTEKEGEDLKKKIIYILRVK